MPYHWWNPFLRFPRSSLLLTVLLALPLLWELKDFRVQSELEVLLRGDQRNLQSYQNVREILQDTEVLVLNLHWPDLFTASGLTALRRVSDAFAALPGVVDVKSLTHSVKPVRQGLSFQMVPMVPPQPWSAETLQELETFCLSHPLVRNIMVSADGNNTIILVTLREDAFARDESPPLTARIGQILQELREEGFHLDILALPLVEEEIKSTLARDVGLMLPATVILLVVILWITFRSWLYLLLILLNQGVATLLLPAMLHAMGFSLTVFSVMLLPLLTGLHLTLLAHVCSSFQRALARHGAGLAAMESMMQEVFQSCSFATLTTMAGLSSLLLSDVPQIREFGLLGVLGLGLIFLLTFGPGLALLQWLSSKASMEGALRAGGGRPGLAMEGASSKLWMRFLHHLARRRPVWLWALGVVLVVGGGLGWSLLRTDVRAVEFLNPQSPTRQALQTLDRIYGGINVVQIEVDSGQPQGVNDDAFLRFLDQWHRETQDRPETSGVYSYAQLLAMMNQIWEGGRPDEMHLPGNVLLRNLFVLALRTQKFPFLTALADPDYQRAYLVLRTPDMPANRYLDLIHEVLRRGEKLKPEGVTLSATRGLHSILEADRQIVRSQVKSAGSAALFIGVLLLILWRSPGLAMLALLANAIPVGLVMAVAGFAGIPLNSITVMVAAIGLGIAVDDTVHFLTHWRNAAGRGMNGREAFRETFRVKARPITATSAALTAVFGLFALSSFPPVVHFGALCAVAFAGAWLSVWLLLPLLLGGFSKPHSR